MRIGLGICYDGTDFHGWQRQPGLRTVQQNLETALSQIADTEITVTCAGRTDAGVHAMGQVIHFDSTTIRSLKAWQMGANRYLPSDMAVLWAQEMAADFHARFSALSRTYHYVIYNSPLRPVFERLHVTWIPKKLDALLMQEAGQYLLGEHDFSAFRASECQSSSPMRNIHSLTVHSEGQHLIVTITANAFLHHMVRNIVGALLVVGQHKRPASWLSELLNARDRSLAAATAPSAGLSLMHVCYPAYYQLPYPNQCLKKV